MNAVHGPPQGLQRKGTELDEGFYSLFMCEEDCKMCLFHVDACDSINMQKISWRVKCEEQIQCLPLEEQTYIS